MKLPKELHNYLGSIYKITKAAHGENHGALLIEASAGSFVLKVSDKDQAKVVRQEFRILKTLKSKEVWVAEAIFYCVEGAKEYFLFSRLKGKDLTTFTDAPAIIKHKLVASCAKALRMIHSWQPKLKKDENWLSNTLKRAKPKENYLIQGISQFNNRNALELYEFAKANLEHNPTDLVFGHGDYCVPNVLIQSNKVTGVVDWGDAAYLDKRFDLATAVMSLRYNFKEEVYVTTFLNSYGYQEDVGTLDVFEALYKFM